MLASDAGTAETSVESQLCVITVLASDAGTAETSVESQLCDITVLASDAGTAETSVESQLCVITVLASDAGTEEVLGYRRISASAQVGLLSALSHILGTSCEFIATAGLASLYGSSW